MADFTPDEIQAAVEQLVQGSITRTVGTLGTRSTDQTFSDIQTAVAGTFILYEMAPFYCVYLGAQRLRDAVTAENTILNSLLEAVESLDRLILPLTDVSPLFNANAALQALQAAVAGGAPADITKLPQYQRFNSNVNAFLAGPAGTSVKQNGAIVPTPDEARAAIPQLMTQLQAAHLGLVQSAAFLANSMDDFATVNLPALVAAGVVSKASQVLGAHASDLAALPIDQRLASIRGVILDMLTAQATVTAFGSFSPPSPFYNIQGLGFPYADSDHPATPAVLTSDTGPSFNVLDDGSNNTLTLTMDGGAPFDVLLPNSFYAVLGGTVVEQIGESPPNGYLISDGTQPVIGGDPLPENDTLYLRINDRALSTSVTVTITLTPSADQDSRRTAQNICDDINPAIVTAGYTDIIAEPYFYPSVHYQGELNITSTGGANAQFDLPPAPPSFTGSLAAVLLGDIVNVPAGPNAGLWDVYSVTSTTQFLATIRVGSSTTESLRLLSVGPSLRAVRIRCTGATNIANERSIAFLGPDIVSQSACGVFGWVPSNTQTCSGLLPSDVVSAINQQTQEDTADTTLITTSLPMSVRSDPFSPFHVIMSKILTTGTVVYTPGTPNSIAVSALSGLLAAGVIVGDILVLRGQGSTAWSVTAVTDTTITATSAATATNGSGLSIEIGPNFPIVEWGTLQVLDGPNEGKYVIDAVGISPIDIQLKNRTSISHFVNPATQTPVVMPNAKVGLEVLTFASANTTTSSSVAVSGDAATLFFTLVTPSVIGSSPWFFIPQPIGAVPAFGDLLEFYTSNYAVPNNVFAISSVDQAATGLILGISPNAKDSPTSWQFTPQPPPYADIRKAHRADFAQFESDLNVWLDQPVNQPGYFQNLNRLINPLLANKNATAVDINVATTAIVAIAQLLTILEAEATDPGLVPLTLESALVEYSVDPVAPVDALIKTYAQQGSDKALDTLLAGQFSTFFSLDVDNVSYGGAMQSAMRAVAQNDLSVNKNSRTDVVNKRALGIAQSEDYEYSSSDTETGATVDAPADFEKST